MKPLSVGNVVSAGLRIYRDNFKKYYRLAFIAALWSWIPIYGWAKFYAAQGLISRLAFNEITENPETARDAERHVKGRLWSFLGAAFLVGLRFTVAYFLGAIALAICLGILITVLIAGLSSVFGNSGTTIASVISILLGVAGFIVFASYLIRLLASFFVSELALAVEENPNASQALKRSQELTKGYVVNVVTILLISSLISFPLWGLVFALQMLPSLIRVADLPLPIAVFYIFQLVFNSVTSALIIPLWQSIKAVIYSDLRVRREGMGIDLRK